MGEDVVMIKGIFAFLCTTILLLSSAHANDRQTIYDVALADSYKLITAFEENQPRSEIRKRVVILAESLKVLAFSEAEARVSDKIAPPPGAELPTLSNDILIMDMQPGPLTTINTVPNDWFTGYLEISRTVVSKILKGFDQDSNGNLELAHIQAESVKKAIGNIIQPPQ